MKGAEAPGGRSAPQSQDDEMWRTLGIQARDSCGLFHGVARALKQASCPGVASAVSAVLRRGVNRGARSVAGLELALDARVALLELVDQVACGFTQVLERL